MTMQQDQIADDGLPADADDLERIAEDIEISDDASSPDDLPDDTGDFLPSDLPEREQRERTRRRRSGGRDIDEPPFEGVIDEGGDVIPIEELPSSEERRERLEDERIEEEQLQQRISARKRRGEPFDDLLDPDELRYTQRLGIEEDDLGEPIESIVETRAEREFRLGQESARADVFGGGIEGERLSREDTIRFNAASAAFQQSIFSSGLQYANVLDAAGIPEREQAALMAEFVQRQFRTALDSAGVEIGGDIPIQRAESIARDIIDADRERDVFEANNVQGAQGQYITRQDFDSLSASEQQIFLNEGLNALNRSREFGQITVDEGIFVGGAGEPVTGGLTQGPRPGAQPRAIPEPIPEDERNAVQQFFRDLLGIEAIEQREGAQEEINQFATTPVTVAGVDVPGPTSDVFPFGSETSQEERIVAAGGDPLAATLAEREAAIGLVPVLSSVYFWNRMGPVEKGVSVGLDIATLTLPFVAPQIVSGIRSLRGTSNIARAQAAARAFTTSNLRNVSPESAQAGARFIELAERHAVDIANRERAAMRVANAAQIPRVSSRIGEVGTNESKLARGALDAANTAEAASLRDLNSASNDLMNTLRAASDDPRLAQVTSTDIVTQFRDSVTNAVRQSPLRRAQSQIFDSASAIKNQTDELISIQALPAQERLIPFIEKGFVNPNQTAALESPETFARITLTNNANKLLNQRSALQTAINTEMEQLKAQLDGIAETHLRLAQSGASFAELRPTAQQRADISLRLSTLAQGDASSLHEIDSTLRKVITAFPDDRSTWTPAMRQVESELGNIQRQELKILLSSEDISGISNTGRGGAPSGGVTIIDPSTQSISPALAQAFPELKLRPTGGFGGARPPQPRMDVTAISTTTIDPFSTAGPTRVPELPVIDQPSPEETPPPFVPPSPIPDNPPAEPVIAQPEFLPITPQQPRINPSEVPTPTGPDVDRPVTQQELVISEQVSPSNGIVERTGLGPEAERTILPYENPEDAREILEEPEDVLEILEEPEDETPRTPPIAQPLTPPPARGAEDSGRPPRPDIDLDLEEEGVEAITREGVYPQLQGFRRDLQDDEDSEDDNLYVYVNRATGETQFSTEPEFGVVPTVGPDESESLRTIQTGDEERPERVIQVGDKTYALTDDTLSDIDSLERDIGRPLTERERQLMALSTRTDDASVQIEEQAEDREENRLFEDADRELDAASGGREFSFGGITAQMSSGAVRLRNTHDIEAERERRRERQAINDSAFSKRLREIQKRLDVNRRRGRG